MFIYSVSLPLCVCTAFQLPPPVQHTTQLSRQVLAFYSNRGGMITCWKYGNPLRWCQPQLTPHLEPRPKPRNGRMFGCDGTTGVGHDPNRGWMDVPGSTASIIKESQVLSPDGQELLFYCTVPGLSQLQQIPTDIFQRAIDPRLPAGIKQPPAFCSRSECRLKGREKLGVWSSISLQRAFFTCTKVGQRSSQLCNSSWDKRISW